ncbi:hypothetical protein AALP_AA7G236900 [Arabis alpina]|uniref:ADP-ribosyl cyclase/cyclic ADP-ribose hydrolase n=1 Tax=Arabis alpina TaxID=50452 RepID=A0A087GK47_ARAAL|nr:hypothetical protein AALP_AA7G236900 [Arabis alpina]
MVASSSSSDQSPPQHQVFINFRGIQLRNSFVSHLAKALRKDGINVFIDNHETKGKDLTVFFSRIEQSRIAIAIFSSLYTESKWCLDELEKIKECVDLGKLVVIPIFFKVETDDVKNLKGVFGEKFWELAKNHSEKIHKWKKALETVTEKLGFTLSEMSNEGEFIDLIVKEVIKVLSDVSTDQNVGEKVIEIPIENHPCAGDEKTTPDLPPPLFGIKTRLAKLEEMLDFECERTLTIGVVGMPGIGKTTLTKLLYEKWQHKFLRCVFLHDVRKLWKDRMMDRNIFMKELLKDDDVNQEVTDLSPESLKAFLLSKKSLVVLDNVSDKKQIEVLLGECDWIKRGSRIFITTSDRSVIEGKVDDTYEVLRLSGRDSFQYFSYFAFSGKLCTPEGNFMNLARLFADYAKGNPLALKILGVELNEKDKTHWEKKLCELSQSPNKTIQDVLQISYDGLGQLQKEVFLDVACFFRSGDEYYVRCLVESCDTENIDAVSEIKDLACKFLINISGGRVEMHDLLYTFGKELGSQGSRRLWNHKGVVGALKKRAGAGSVRVAIGNAKLTKLPKDFNPRNLTDLNLPYSEIEEVWEGVKDTPKLKWVDLSHSSKLCNLSGLRNAESLLRLNLEGCTSLQELPQEMKRMRRLIFLNMRGCTSLRFLPHMNLISLKTLILTNCSSLQDFRRLIVLNLKDCKKLVAVPECLGKLKALQELVLSGCSKLKTFPVPIENMKCLQILLLDGTAITDMPRILQFNSEIPRGINGLSSLRRLCLSGNNMISNLQINISQLCHLKWLDLKYCKNLTSIPLLPPNLEILDAHGCKKLKTVASPMAVLKLMEQVQSKFIFTNCNNLEEAAKSSITSYAQRKSQLDAVRCYKEGNVSETLLITSFPGNEVPSWFNHRTIGNSLELKFPPHWCDNRLSTLVLCAVVTFPYTQDQISRFSIECTCEFKNELGTCIRFSCVIGGGWIEPRKIDSDHVFIGYTSCSQIINHVEGSLQSRDHQKCVPTEAFIEFKVRDGLGEIVNCGLSLVYEEPNHVVSEGNSNETSSRRDVSIVSVASGFLSIVLRFPWVGVVFFFVYGFARFFR